MNRFGRFNLSEISITRLLSALKVRLNETHIHLPGKFTPLLKKIENIFKNSRESIKEKDVSL